jgi:DNA-binding transcriptional LysR family regulator
MLLENLQLFLVIAERGSLIGAARETGMSSTRVSERLAALEAHYGVVLFNRTTRSISLTEEGRILEKGAKSVVREISDLDALIRFGAETLSGPIRISAPIDLGRSIVSNVIAAFTQENPEVSIELSLSDGYVDMVGQGFDLAIRFGKINDTSLRIHSLGNFQRLVCASPCYLQKHGAPKKPGDLTRHNCFVMRFGVNLDNVWEFGSGSKRQRIQVSGNRIVDDGSLIRSWALAGEGVVLKSELDVRDDISDGKLVSLLEKYLPPPTPLQLMLPPARSQPRRVSALAEKFVTTIGVV